MRVASRAQAAGALRAARAARALWAEPRPDVVPPRGVRDLALAVAFFVLGVVEAALRPGLEWRSANLAAVAVLAPLLPSRRARPLAVGLASVLVGSAAAVLTGGPGLQLFSFAVLLVLPYALARWGSGRDLVLGGTAMAAQTLLTASLRHTTSDLVGGLAVLLTALAVGLSVRYRAAARRRSLEQVRLRERERLARDLHDTVAHHVSAIAIRAQAGLAVADVDPSAAPAALRLIETEASRTLAELRALVRLLRDAGPVDLAPGPRLADVAALADAGPVGTGVRAVAVQPVPVTVEVVGDPDAVSPAVGGAAYRIVQEAVTNARRHARGAARIHVRVAVDADRVRLSVADDGDPGASDADHGHGLVGMRERAQLLGGRFRAGPSSPRGWVVEADLPRTLGR